MASAATYELLGERVEAQRHSEAHHSCYTAHAMDVKSLHTLELEKILDRLAGYAAFSASKDAARRLTPTSDLAEAVHRQTQTTEARRLFSVNARVSVGGAHDVRPEASIASHGGVLEPAQLLDIKGTLQSADRLRRLFAKAAEAYPALAGIAHNLEPCNEIVDAVARALNDRGDVLDSASPRLAEIRTELRVAHDRLTGKLQRILADPKYSPMLQEPIITQRDGRFVIPLRAEFKGQLKAVVHDQSASGATLFIEPLEAVDLNNEIRELQLAERDEVRRILASISDLIGRWSQSIDSTVCALADLDLAFAKGRYAEDLRATEPILRDFRDDEQPGHPGSVLRLLGARHPLLGPAEVVPIDFDLPKDAFALVITGPNTGGKTVSLKTAGLLALMAQCGMHIPAESGSEVTVFDSVYADIGDEQSIEQSLSTFSSHISNIINILEHADRRSLVVLDELGAGTDPQEGAALARAILDVLLERNVTTLVATHYPELKSYAHTTQGVRNASVEFDLESLRPTFRLTIGLPGRSNALAIAERLGLDRTLVERARQRLTPEDLQTESLLDEIHRQHDASRLALEEAQQARDGAREVESSLEERLAGIEEERRAILEEARQKSQATVESLEQEVAALRRKLAVAAQPLEALEAVQADVDVLADEVAVPAAREGKEGTVPSFVFQLGDRVLLRTLGTQGVITNLGGSHAEVQVGRLRVKAALDELRPPEEQTARQRAEETTIHSSISTAAPQAPPLELDLRGRTAEEALEELERRLDAAFLAGLPFIRVIHGKGTGRLRQAIREYVRENPYVASFESGREGEGGDGVTIIKLSRI
jgi:DNA mismatch repair protein MutS2